jgi:glycosyltransferase involved in cell wall biosynthesis
MGVGLVHYYNSVLNKMQQLEGFEVLNLVPQNTRGHIEEGVFQTRQGVEFTVHSLPEFSVTPFLRCFRAFPSFLRRVKPDIIVFTQYYLPMFIFDLPVLYTVKRLGIKLVLKSIPFPLETFRDYLQKIKTAPLGVKLPIPLKKILHRIPSLLWILRRVMLEYRRLSFRLPNAHVNYVDEAYNILGSYGVPRERIFITHNSPDTDRLFQVRNKVEQEPAILPHSSNRLVHVGRLVPWKKTDMLIRAFAAVKGRFKDAELLVIGDGPELVHLKSLAQSSPLADSVKFLGGVYDPLFLGRYLRASTIYVLAGMGGLSINDAMIFGLPVICSVCDGTEKRLVREGVNGMFFQEGNQKDLEDKIVFLLSRPDLIKEMGIRSTQIIRDEINIHTVLRGYLKSFNYVMGRDTTRKTKCDG